MNSFRIFKRNPRYVAVTAALLLFAAVPALASAAQLTDRSIALSSASAGATGVTYEVKFTAPGAAQAVVIDFCSDTPVIGQDCVAPGGFSVTGAESATSGFTASATDANTIVVNGTIAASAEVTFELEGVNNPSAAGPLYARVITYSDTSSADSYQSTNLGSDVVDQGSIAISITPTVGVSGAVLETMTFCIANKEITTDCGNADEEGNEPVLALGEIVDGTDIRALTTDVSTGSLYAQISTNAVNGAVVRLKSSVPCGGLLMAGDTSGDCHIKPAPLTAEWNASKTGEAMFGMRAVAAADSSGSATGTLQAAGNYGSEYFVMNYDDNETPASGVTAVYGDPILDTNDAPANNKNVQLIFGASISNDTPAGLHSTDLSMIATGKF